MTVKSRPTTRRDNPIIKFSVVAESWRFYAYCAFWFFVAFAITISKIFVTPLLAAGSPDGRPCGPFNRDAPDFGVLPGKGFDFKTQSHLNQLFGFANICVNWDYSPSRELTGLLYPLFEYSLLIYLILDFVVIKLSYMRGELNEWFYLFCKIIFPINLILASWFRMIFICIAYENPSQHTMGFLGLQIALLLVAIQNVLYLIDSKECLSVFGSVKNTRIAAIIYLVGDIIISFFKLKSTIYVVGHGRGAPWTLTETIIPGFVMGRVVDLIWMLFNALAPFIISYIRSKSEYPLDITITSEEPTYVEGEEGKPLTKGRLI